MSKTKFGDEAFHYSTFLVLLQSVGNALVAATVLLVQQGTAARLTAGVAVHEWSIAALGYFGAHKFGLTALHYISFPMQVVCKSCKAIPVMFGEKIFARKRHSLAKTMSVYCMCVAVVMFTLLGPSKAKSTSTSASTIFDSKTAIGLALVFGALVCDGIYGPYQAAIQAVPGRSVTAWHLMFNMNMYQGALSLIVCLVYGELHQAISFCERHPAVLKVLALFAAAMALGNIFIYQLQAGYGALSVTTVTTLRKLISIVASAILFGHKLTLYQWLAVAIVIFQKQEGALLANMLYAMRLAQPLDLPPAKKKD